jgi:hypothetical protein
MPPPSARRRHMLPRILAARIRNPHTRRAYPRAADEFPAWCASVRVPSRGAVRPMHVPRWGGPSQQRRRFGRSLPTTDRDRLWSASSRAIRGRWLPLGHHSFLVRISPPARAYVGVGYDHDPTSRNLVQSLFPEIRFVFGQFTQRAFGQSYFVVRHRMFIRFRSPFHDRSPRARCCSSETAGAIILLGENVFGLSSWGIAR